MKKTLLFHDTFLMRGGAERMNLMIADILDADIATGYRSKGSFEIEKMGRSTYITNPRFRRGMLGFIIMKISFFLFGYSDRMREYTHLFFSNEAISGVWGVRPGQKTYYYAHSISRHLFDQKDEYLKKIPMFLRPIYHLVAGMLRYIYKKEISKIGKIFVNSAANKVRMKEWFHRDDAIVLSPPVDTEIFKIFDKDIIMQTLAIEGINASYKDYYISFARLTHAKRIDVIIEAFKGIPEKNIIIIYGENDSQKDEFMKLGDGYKNIIFHSLRDNRRLPHIIGGAIASIAVSKEEDFGMVAIESMACGVPVIAVDEGGYRETLIDGKTGILLKIRKGTKIKNDNLSTLLINNLSTTLQTTSKEKLCDMERACLKRSERYSLERFKELLIHHTC